MMMKFTEQYDVKENPDDDDDDYEDLEDAGGSSTGAGYGVGEGSKC